MAIQFQVEWTFKCALVCVLFTSSVVNPETIYTGAHPRPVDSNLLYYEPVHYDTRDLHIQHVSKQSLLHDQPVILNFYAFNRTFDLHLQPDTFSSDVILVHQKKSSRPDFTMLYTGKYAGYPTSEVTGGIINGSFQGSVTLSRDVIYHIVPSSSVLSESTPFPSVIYLESDYRKNHTQFDEIHGHYRHYTDMFLNNAEGFRTRVRRESRDERAIFFGANESLEKKVCTLKLTTDQTVWRYMMTKNDQNELRSLNEIIVILNNHFRQLKSVFKEATFTIHKDKVEEQDVTGLEFDIRKIEVYTDKDCEDNKHDPLCIENVNGETLLRNFADTEYFKSSSSSEYSEYIENYGEAGEYPDYNSNDYANYDPVTDPDVDKINAGFEEFLHQPNFCLSFLFTARVLYSNNGNPLLGLTYGPPRDGGGGGGICGDNGNNGFVTLFMSTDKQLLPPPMTQLVFTHEVAHSFGALHDNTVDCRGYNLRNEPEDGFYLMHSIAQNGGKPNNRKFSQCSLDNMGLVLSQSKSVVCFKKTARSICGNGIIEDGEECDCGSRCHLDNCCHGHGRNKSDTTLDCKLKSNATCSPSQGPCCESETCDYINKSDNVVCQNERPCMDTLFCDGDRYGAACPPPTSSQVRPDDFVCETLGRVKVCSAGNCNTSICTLIGWNECQLTNSNDKLTLEEKEELCYVGCQETRRTECISTNNNARMHDFPYLEHLLNNVSLQTTTGSRAIQFPIGTPCNGMTGYCDVFMRCRGVDPDTPLMKLRRCFETGECFMVLQDFATHHWWLIALGTISGILVVFACVKCCAVHTKSSNPILEFKHPRRSVRQSYNSVRHSMTHVGHSVRHSVGRQFSNISASFRGGTLPRMNNEVNRNDAKDEQELRNLTKNTLDVVKEINA